MKKTLSKKEKLLERTLPLIIVSLVVLLTILSILFFCGNDNDPSALSQHYELGIYYSIPENFELRNLTYGDLTYKCDDVYFIVIALDETDIWEDRLLPLDITPVEYADIYVTNLPSEYATGVEYVHNKEDNTVEFEYVAESDSEYSKHKILRSETHLYHMVLICDDGNQDKYEDLFSRIMDSIRL